MYSFLSDMFNIPKVIVGDMIVIKEYPKLKLEILQVFHHVMIQGSFSRAAIHLGITQPAVSKMMQKMAHHFDATLFVRSKSGISPTNTAFELHRSISPHLNSLEKTLISYNEFDPKTSSRHFKITCPESLSSHLLSFFSALDNPKIKVSIYNQPYSTKELENAIFSHTQDLFIDYSDLNHMGSINSQALFHDLPMVIVGESNQSIQGSITLEQFLEAPFIQLERTRDGQSGIDYLTSAPLSKRNIVASSVSLFETLIQVSSSNLITTAPASFAKKYAEKLSLKLYPLPFSCEPVTTHMLWHKKFDKDKGLMWLREQIIESCAIIDKEDK